MGKIWIQDWGTYGEQTLVCIGVTKEEILKWLKKVKGKPMFIAAIEECFEVPTQCDGCFWYHSVAKGSILWLESLEYTPKSMAILSHEICHAVRRLLIEERNMVNEVEAICYQTEYLTKSILREALR
jgi:hypothetical protein